MSHDRIVEQTQALLDQVGRRCLRAIVSEDLPIARVRRLAKFCFGCMNQKHELPGRVERYGYREIDKVLRFVQSACRELAAIVDEEYE